MLLEEKNQQRGGVMWPDLKWSYCCHPKIFSNSTSQRVPFPLIPQQTCYAFIYLVILFMSEDILNKLFSGIPYILYPLHLVSFFQNFLVILIWQRNSACHPTKKLQSTKPENVLITTDNYKALTLETPDKMYKLCRLFFIEMITLKWVF